MRWLRSTPHVPGSMSTPGHGGRTLLSGPPSTLKLSPKTVCRVTARMRLPSGYVGWGDKTEFFKVLPGCLSLGRQQPVVGGVMDTRAAMVGAFLWWFCRQVELAGTLVNMVDGVVIRGIEIQETVILVPIRGVRAEGSIEFLGDRRGRGIRRKFITSAKQHDSVNGQAKIRVKLYASIWQIVIKILVPG